MAQQTLRGTKLKKARTSGFRARLKTAAGGDSQGSGG